MRLRQYQRNAIKTVTGYDLETPEQAIPAVLGLASQTGAIHNVYKKHLANGTNLRAFRRLLQEELGDALWYVAAIAAASKLDLGEIAELSLKRNRDRFGPQRVGLHTIPQLDRRYRPDERFPRRITIRFEQRRDKQHGDVARLTLVDAFPNYYPQGARYVNERKKGFTIGEQVGAEVNDNSRRADAYRFHDAIHMGFAAVLGWSPTLRAMLGLKRKSDRTTDRTEDGARAIYAEEGLAAVLAQLAPSRNRFNAPSTVDGDALRIVRAARTNLEVEAMPLWLWPNAISQGFIALDKLNQHKGGLLTADLDARVLRFRKVPSNGRLLSSASRSRRA